MKELAWFEKYRPESIDDMIFESPEHERLCRSLVEKGIPGNILLFGPPGTGKTTFARILIKTYIKNRSDLFKCSKRSVAEIDELATWILRKPISSPFKIVYFEEIDKLSREAQSTLKDGLMERYQEHTKFIATTNWVNRLDSALVSRFDIKIHFSGKYSPESLYKRIKYILDNEQIKYDEEQLKQFIEKLTSGNAVVDMRMLLSSLQMASVDGSIDFNKITVLSSFEQKVVDLILQIVNKVMSLPVSQRLACAVNPLHAPVTKTAYAELLQLLRNDLHYESIFYQLYESIELLPLKIIVGNYVNEMQYKAYQDIHLLACLYEMLTCLASLATV